MMVVKFSRKGGGVGDRLVGILFKYKTPRTLLLAI